MKEITVHRTKTEYTTVFSREEVANALFEALPLKQRLPGSPRLSILFNSDGLELTQTHDDRTELK